jgi:hypothetical protein
MSATSEGRKFVDTGEGYWIDDPRNPMGAVGYEEPMLLEMFGAARLERMHFVPGAWWSSPYAQDVLVVRKA